MRQQHEATQDGSTISAKEMGALLKRLPGDTPVKRIAHALVSGRRVASIQPLIDAIMKLPAKRWRERETLVKALGQATNEDRDVAAAILSGILENDSRRGLFSRIAPALGLAGLLLLLGPVLIHLFNNLSVLLIRSAQQP